MIILLPNNSLQTISFMPRFAVTSGNVELKVRKDGYGDEEVVSGFIATQEYGVRVVSDGGEVESLDCVDDLSFIVSFYNESYYSDINISLDFLEEGETYYIEFTHEGKLWYRDKIYATTQTDYKVKHKQSQNNYKQYDELDDNTYIIRN